MPREYIAIALGAVSMALSFVPSNIVQLVGFLLGVVAFGVARMVKREDYRRDLPCTVAQVMGVAGAVLCCAVRCSSRAQPGGLGDHLGGGLGRRASSRARAGDCAPVFESGPSMV